jgi:hypothetical protein
VWPAFRDIGKACEINRLHPVVNEVGEDSNVLRFANYRKPKDQLEKISDINRELPRRERARQREPGGKG